MARPSFKPTPEMRRKVAVAAGGGMSHEEIALGLGITRPTLEKHFQLELSTGAYQKRLEVMVGLQRAAKKGNVAAAKAYLLLQPKVALPPDQPGAVPAVDGKPGDVKAEPLGKKAAAEANAVTAAQGTEWNDLLKPIQTH